MTTMVGTDLLEQLKHLTNAERLAVIEAATRLVREDLLAHTSDSRDPRKLEDDRWRAAAAELRDLYEPGGELTEWTVLDGEEVLDDSLPESLPE